MSRTPAPVSRAPRRAVPALADDLVAMIDLVLVGIIRQAPAAAPP